MLKPGDIIISTKPYIEEDLDSPYASMMGLPPAKKSCTAYMLEPCVFIASTLHQIVLDVRKGAVFIPAIMPIEEFQAREFVRADPSLQLVLTRRLIAAHDAMATPPGSFMQMVYEADKNSGRSR